MVLGLFHAGQHPEPSQYLYARTRLLDGSEFLVALEDTLLVFETRLGLYRVPLRRVVRMHNIANVVALREYLWASRFEIFNQDGDRVIGVPKSPRVLHLHSDENLMERGQLKLCEIDWLIVKGECH